MNADWIHLFKCEKEILEILIKKYLKFNILKLLHFQNHTYIWKSWDQIFEFLRLKYYFNYTSIFARILLYALYVFFDDSSALIYEDTMKIKEDNKVDFFNKVSKYYLRKKKKSNEDKILFFLFFFNFKCKTKLISRSSLFIGFNFTYEL